jgi:hypothetical protein
MFNGLGFGPLHDPWRSALALMLEPKSIDEARALVDDERGDRASAGVSRLLADSPAGHQHARSLVETRLSSAYRKLDLSGRGARRRLGGRVASAA